MAIYHCQQAAEKAVKGWLQSQDDPFPKTHDIEDLTAQAARLNGDFSQFAKSAAVLTPYVSAFRYPGSTGIVRVFASSACEIRETVPEYVGSGYAGT